MRVRQGGGRIYPHTAAMDEDRGDERFPKEMFGSRMSKKDPHGGKRLEAMASLWDGET